MTGFPQASGWGFSGTDWGATAVARSWDRSDASEAFDRSLMASSTAWQRAVGDMKAAGINPMLAVSQGPASSPQAPLPHRTMPGVGANMHLQTSAQTELLQASADKTRAEADKLRSETMPNEKLADKLQAEIDFIKTQRATSSSQMNVNQQHTKVLREEARIKLKEAEAAERFLMGKSAAELQIILAEARHMKTEGEIDDSQFGIALRYLERVIRTIGGGIAAALGGYLGGRAGRGGQGLRPGGGVGVRPPRQTSPDYFRSLRKE